MADLEDRFRLQGGDQDRVRKEIVALAIAHTLLTRFTSFVVVDESETVNKGGEGHKVVQPVHLPALWEMERDDASRVAAPHAGAGAPAGVASLACMAPPVPPASPAPAKCQSAPSEKMKKRSALGGLFGKKAESEPEEAREERKVSASERKAFEKAVEALKEALEAARSELSAGRIPPVGPVERARKALLEALGASALGTRLSALQRLLRAGLLELSAALAASAPAEAPSVSTLLDRCRAELEEALRQGPAEARFWEKTV